MSVDEQIRSAVQSDVSHVGVGQLLSADAISVRGARRQRRQRVVRGLATVLVACIAFVGVGALRGNQDTTAVFASDPDAPETPTKVVRVDDFYVGISAIDPFEHGPQGNAEAEFVTSTDGITWTRPGAPINVGRGLEFAERDGVFHMVLARTVESPEAEVGSPSEDEMVFIHATSTDLITWDEQPFTMPPDLVGDDYLPTFRDLEVVDDSLVLLVQKTPLAALWITQLEDIGREWADVCYARGESNRDTIRLCGESEALQFERDSDVPLSFVSHALRITDGVATEITLPVIPGVPKPAGSNPSLYRTPDGVGINAYYAFESTDGIVWEQVETMRDRRVLMAVRGDERVYRTERLVQRFGDGDVAFGLAYSANDGETWDPIEPSDVFGTTPTGPDWYSNLVSGDAGWAFIAHRPGDGVFADEIDGVEMTVEGDSHTFVLTTPDGFVLSGNLPFGEASLLDPEGRLIREWAILEPSNPVWSGLEMFEGDVVLLTDDGEHIAARFPIEQWGELLDEAGPSTRYQIVFSPNGIDWSIIDSGTGFPQIQTLGDTELVLTKWQPGIYSLALPDLVILPLPVPPEPDE